MTTLFGICLGYTLIGIATTLSALNWSDKRMAEGSIETVSTAEQRVTAILVGIVWPYWWYAQTADAVRKWVRK